MEIINNVIWNNKYTNPSFIKETLTKENINISSWVTGELMKEAGFSKNKHAHIFGLSLECCSVSELGFKSAAQYGDIMDSVISKGFNLAVPENIIHIALNSKMIFKKQDWIHLAMNPIVTENTQITAILKIAMTDNGVVIREGSGNLETCYKSNELFAFLV